MHFHICVIDGVFSQGADGALRFHPAAGLDGAAVAAVAGLVRQRVLRLYERSGRLDAQAAQTMRQWRHGGGFSVDASVRVNANDRASERVRYRLPKPRPDGTALRPHGERAPRSARRPDPPV